VEAVAVSQPEKITSGGQKCLYDWGRCRDWQVFFWGQIFLVEQKQFLPSFMCCMPGIVAVYGISPLPVICDNGD